MLTYRYSRKESKRLKERKLRDMRLSPLELNGGSTPDPHRLPGRAVGKSAFQA